MPVFQSIVGLNHRCFIFSFLFFFPKKLFAGSIQFQVSVTYDYKTIMAIEIHTMQFAANTHALNKPFI